MEPISLSATTILALVDWKKAIGGLATDEVRTGAKSVLGRLLPNEREKATKEAIKLFVEEFLAELDDKTDLTSSLPGYQDQLRRLIELAGPHIADWMQPDTKNVDLGLVQRMWSGIGFDKLPEDFDWALVARNYERAIRKYLRSNPAFHNVLTVALLEEAKNIQSRIAGPDPGFDLTGYRDYLRKKCAVLQLSAMHTSTYDHRIHLWNVFVPQSARESAPARDLPREILRRLRQEGQIENANDDDEIARLLEGYQSSPISPVLDVLKRDRLVVVLGDPGSGKTSLLKFLVMRWVNQVPETKGRKLLPVWIDLKEYAQERDGLLKYCQSGCTAYGLNASEVEKRLKTGEAALYVDGLDEIFDGLIRGSVIEEITVFAARYSQAPVVVTSRIVGYEAERLRNAGFTHATLEDFDDKQVSEFLHKWYVTAEDDAKERARLTGRLERTLKESRAVRELAGNPLLLTMMAILNRNQDLPRDRVELYAQASRVLLHEWDASRALPVDTFARQEKEELLRELAGTMQQSEGGLAGNLIERTRLIDLFRTFLKGLGVPDPHGKATSLVRQLTERNFILCFAGADRFSFVHRTFLEYFCAAWFVEQFQVKQTLSIDQLKHDIFGLHWKDEKWHEVLRLIAGMVGEKQAEELILFLMEQDGRHDKLANLMLAAGCLSEVRTRRAIQATSDALRLRFVEEVIRYNSPSDYQPYMEFFEVAPTREKAMGLIALAWRSEETLTWLRSIAGDDQDLIVRLAAIRELARSWKDDPETLCFIKDLARSDEAPPVPAATVQELVRGWKNHPDTLPWLKRHARPGEHPHLRVAAVQELAQGWKDDPETLPLLKDFARSDENEYVRKVAVLELARSWKGFPETLPILKDLALYDDNEYVRQVAVHELARCRTDDRETLAIVKNLACSDESHFVRWAAVQDFARVWKEDPETLPFLIDRARSDENNNVRLTVMRVLAQDWKEDPKVIAMLGRSNSEPE
jgi:hypothetical protein